VTRNIPEPLELDPNFTAEEQGSETGHHVFRHGHPADGKEWGFSPRAFQRKDVRVQAAQTPLFILLAAVFLIVILFGGGTP
jgi:hypothetical protein